MRAITERLRISAENEGRRRGITRAAINDHGGILLPADDIDLSPHTPALTVIPDAAAHEAIGDVEATQSDLTPDVDPDFSFGTGWLSDR